MSSFDYLKSAIKQKGCTLQQAVAGSQRDDQRYPSQLNAKIKSPSAQKLRSAASFRAGGFRRQKASAWCLVSFTRCILGTST